MNEDSTNQGQVIRIDARRSATSGLRRVATRGRGAIARHHIRRN